MNILIHRLIEWASGNRPPPFRLDLRPTMRCNLKCIACSRRERKNEVKDIGEELPPDKLVALVKEAGAFGVKHIELIGGGEPMMAPHILALIKEIKKQDIFGDMTTNGTMFDTHIVKRMVELGWDQIMFSIDAPDAETHDYMRARKGAFEESIGNIKLFKYWKEQLGKNRPRIGLIPILTNRNYNRLCEMLQLGHDVGADVVEFKPLYVRTEQAGKLKMTEKEREQLPEEIKKAEILARKYNMDTNFKSLLDENIIKKSTDIPGLIKSDLKEFKSACQKKDSFLSLPCFQPWYYIAVNSNGTASPCAGSIPIFDNKSNVKDNTLRDIWYSPAFDRFRDVLLRGELPHCCRKCCGGIILDTRRFRDELLKTVE